MKSKYVSMLEKAGYEVLAVHGRWFEVSKNGEAALILRQADNIWHWFLRYHGATASGAEPSTCDSGLIGDVIGTDREMRSYCDLIKGAPERLVSRYAGLYEAAGQVFCEEESLFA